MLLKLLLYVKWSGMAGQRCFTLGFSLSMSLELNLTIVSHLPFAHFVLHPFEIRFKQFANIS